MTREQMQRTMTLLYTYRALRAALVIAPFLVPYRLSQGLNQTDISVLQAVFSLVVALTVVPGGFLADHFGRKPLIVAGGVLWTAGMAVYALGSTFWPLFGAEVLLGMALGAMVGAVSALAYGLRGPEGYCRYEGRSVTAEGVAQASAAFIGSGVVLWAPISVLFWVQVLISAGMVGVALAMREPANNKVVASPLSRLIGAARLVASRPQLIWLVGYGAITLALIHCSVWLLPRYYQAAGMPIKWFGVATAVQVLGWALVGLVASWLIRRFGQRRAFTLLVAVGAGTYLVGGVWQVVWLLPVLIGFSFVRAIIPPLILTAVNGSVTDEQRATVVSLQDMAQKLVYVPLIILSGFITDSYSVGTTMAIYGAMYAGAGAVLVWGVRRRF